jgi:peptidoglycan/xylan/chitin deacetylase (PgdA/CDA1 family)
VQRLFLAALAATVFTTACDGSSRDRDNTGSAPNGTASDADSVAGALPQVPSMAVTIDDLPWIGAVRPGGTRLEAQQSLATALATRGVPALGFVNCDRVPAGEAMLQPWMDAGLDLGNHSAAHLDLNDAPLERWLSDVVSCHERVRDITGADEVWFRFPYLHQGPDAERQGAAVAMLEEIGSSTAHVTIDNSDWILAVAYGNAVNSGDSARAAAIGEAFVDHIIRATEHYQGVARQKVGRDVPHVLLLHANLLVADHIERLLDRLETEHGFRFITVEDAHRDPIYDLRDDYTGEDGLSWLYRMEPATPEMAEWDDAEAARLRERWRR